MKKYFSLLLLFTLILTFPLSSMAEISDLNQEIDIQSMVNYDLIIEEKTGFYTGGNGYLDLMINNTNSEITSEKTIGGMSYVLLKNNYSENDSISMANGEVTISGISGIGADAQTGYAPKPKQIGIIAGTLSNTVTADIEITYKNNSVNQQTVSISPLTTKDSDTTSVSAGTSLVYKSGKASRFKVEEGAEIFLNSYIITVDPQEISAITFSQGSYHVMAASILYYSESEWMSNVGANINTPYIKYKSSTPNDTALDKNEIDTLITTLESSKADIEAGKDIGLSDEVKTLLSDRGVDAEITRLKMLSDCIGLVAEKQKIKDEMTALDVDGYVADYETDAYKSYDSDDAASLEALIAKFDKAVAIDADLADILAYWEEKGVTVVVAQIDSSDKDKLVAIKADYDAYQLVLSFESELTTVYTLCGEKALEEITDTEFDSVKAFFENADFFESDLTSEYINSDNEARVEKLIYIYKNYEAVKNSDAPYMIDLSNYFSADIFYDNGDSGLDIGFTGGALLSATGSVMTSKLAYKRTDFNSSSFLNKTTGLLSFGSTDIKLGYGYYSDGHVKAADFTSYMGDKALTFDVSKAMKNGNSAVMLPEDGTGGALQTISGVFSGKTAKYLVFLVAIPRDGKDLHAVINYTDGTSYEADIVGRGSTTHRDWFYVDYNSAVDTSAIGGMMSYPMFYDGGWIQSYDQYDNGHPRNAVRIVASAAQVGTYSEGVITANKRIKSIDIYRSRYDKDEITYNVSGNVPILAMTEIPVKNSEFITNVATPAWEAVKNFTEADYTASNIKKLQDASLAYEEAKMRGLKLDEIFVNDDSTSGVSKVEEIGKYVLTATASTKRTKIDEIKSTVSFSVPTKNVEENLTVKKNGQLLNASEYSVVTASDGLSAEIIIPEGNNGGNNYTFTVSQNLPVAAKDTMTMGSDYEYSFEVPDYIQYSYVDKKVINNSDVPVSVTAASVAMGEDGKTVYSADSIELTNVSRDLAADASAISLTKTATNDYVFDESFKLISNSSAIKTTTASTEAGVKYSEPVFNLATNTLTLKGFTPSGQADRIVNLKIYNSTEGKDLYFGSTKTNKDGFFSFEIIIPNIYMTSFNMKLTLGGDDFTAPETAINDIYYSTSYERSELITHIKNAASANDLTNGTIITSGDVTIARIVRDLAIDFEPVALVTDDSFAQSIINIVKDYELSAMTADLELSQKILKQAAILAAYKESIQTAVYADGILKYADIMEYASIDTNGVTLYNIFKNNLSEDGKKAVVEALLGKEYKNVSELYDALEKEIFVKALNYPLSTTIGTGYITDALTAANASAAGADISKFKNNSTYRDAIAANRGKFTDVSSVVSFINAIIYNEPSGDDGYSPSVSTPSSSISASGYDTLNDTSSGAYVDNLPENELSVFSDVSASHWAYKNIMSLYNKGIVSGKGADIFDPEGYVTRGEVVKMICEAYSLTNRADAVPFEDLAGKWYSDYASISYQNKLINGLSETIFGGDERITRQDLCTILYRFKNTSETASVSFADEESISDYAKNAVGYMSGKGVVNGFSDNTFRPFDYCTRAQMSKILDLFIGL